MLSLPVQTRISTSTKQRCKGFSSMRSPEAAVSPSLAFHDPLPRRFARNNSLSPGLGPAFESTKKYKKFIRDFVANGGRYAGFCLGAYLGGRSPGFDLLPPGSDTDEEIIQPGSQVKNLRDTTVQVNWRFHTGSHKGQQQNGRWMYFQDGAVMKLSRSASTIVLGRYSSNNDVAASVTRFGKGWVGLVGPHPEADRSWCQYCVLPSEKNL